jgi:hypothetical protein
MHLTSIEKYYRNLLLNCVEDFQKAAEEKRFVSAEIFVQYLPKEVQRVIKLSKITYWDSLGKDIVYGESFWNYIAETSTGQIICYVFSRIFLWEDTEEGSDYWSDLCDTLENYKFNPKDFLIPTHIKYLL